MEYRAFSNQGFLFQETLRVARRLARGDSEAMVKRQILEENLLELRSLQSRKTVSAALLERLRGIKPAFVTHLLHASSDSQRVMVLLLIAQKHRLLAETLLELQRWHGVSQRVSASSLRVFFVRLRLEDSTLEGWSEATFEKSVSNIVKYLREARILAPLERDWALQAPLLSSADRCAICGAFGPWGLRAVLQPQQGGAS
jgi:hypothetical protein